MKRKVQVTIETRQLLVVSRSTGSIQGRCSECSNDVPLIRPEEAAVLAGVSPRTIYRRAEAGLIHFAESPEGWLLICLGSLLDESRIESISLRP